MSDTSLNMLFTAPRLAAMNACFLRFSWVEGAFFAFLDRMEYKIETV